VGDGGAAGGVGPSGRVLARAGVPVARGGGRPAVGRGVGGAGVGGFGRGVLGGGVHRKVRGVLMVGSGGWVEVGGLAATGVGDGTGMAKEL